VSCPAAHRAEASGTARGVRGELTHYPSAQVLDCHRPSCAIVSILLVTLMKMRTIISIARPLALAPDRF
jgi:hypothetical protein